jgi:hypothetical protein
MAIVRLKGLYQFKKSTSSGLDPATLRLGKTIPVTGREGP